MNLIRRVRDDANSKKSNVCIAPWNSLKVYSNGDVSSDAVNKLIYGNINEQPLSALWQSKQAKTLKESFLKNEIHPSCVICTKKEEAVGRSRRNFFYLLYPEKDQEPLPPLDSAPNILFLEIETSNKCNLKCRMCSGKVSTPWQDEERKIDFKKLNLPERNINSYNKIDNSTLDNLLEDRRYFENIKHLAIRGGEPFLEKENYLILQRFIDWDLADQLTVDISTNGSIWDEEIQKTLSHFKKIKIHLSLDGINDLHSYIRGGDHFTFKQFEENFHKFKSLKNVDVIIAVTVQTYNILFLGDIWNWYLENASLNTEFYCTNTVVSPRYLNFHCLPDDLLNLASERIKKSNVPKGPFRLFKDEQGDPGFKAIMDKIQSKTNLENKDKTLKEFIVFSKTLDKLRNSNIKKVIPEFAELFS